MKKIICAFICAFLIAAIAAFSFAACNVVEENVHEGKSDFVMIEKNSDFYIVYHKETKVMYAVSSANNNYGNFTLLVNADGTPMTYRGKE